MSIDVTESERLVPWNRAEPRMSGGTVTAPGAPVFRSRGRRALDIASDLVLAVLLVWALPLAWAIATAVVRAAVGWLSR